MGDLRFRLLGPVEVVRDGTPAALRHGMLVDLLAALLVSANRALPADDLADMVWHAQPPAHPRAALHNAIARLRRALDGDVIETLAHGYRIRVDADHLDLLEFDELLMAAERGTGQDAERSLGQALELWRGRPLSNVESPVLAARARQLTDRYLDACERWGELCLGAGRYDAVTARLTPMVEAYPFREQLAAQLMTALYQAGRQADALAAYESVRRTLAGELGVDPGPAIQDLHLRILRADPSLRGGDPAVAGPRVPRQLPTDVPDFCGRDGEVTAMEEALTADATPGETPAMVISGAGGVGKTALAVHVAHRLAETFGDGQLFADLNGVAASPAKPDEVLASFLRALGVTGTAIPCSLSERMTMYRSLVADRRLLIVLDNAASASQVRPLLPASPGCAVIVTSRGRMAGLVGSHAVHLGILSGAQALDLLSRIIGHDRTRAEASDVTALAGLCGGLPLALRIAGARLAARPHWPVAKLTGRLADARRGLSELVHGDLDVRASFALSYESLEPVAKTMLRRVSLLDAPDFPAWVGAALLDIGTGEAEDACERLVDAQLLDAAAGSHEIRYRMHDLVRAFARERREDSVAARTAALARAFGGWLALAERAHRRLYGGDLTILHGGASRWTDYGQAVARAAEEHPLSWLEGERHALGAAVRQAADLGLTELSWDLAWTAVTLYEIRHYFDDRLATQEYALAAAEKAGNIRGQAAMLANRASVMVQLGRHDEALGPAEESLRLFTKINDTHGRAIALYRVGLFHARTGDIETAIDVCGEAIRVARLAGDFIIEALSFRELALACLERGDYRAAAEHATRSLRILQDSDNRLARANAMPLHVLGEVHLRRGELAAAEGVFREILAIVHAAGDVSGQAHVLVGLGEALARSGRLGEADERLRLAITLAGQSRQRIVEARALFLFGTLNPGRDSASVRRSHLNESLAIFTALSLPSWQRRVSEALRELAAGPAGRLVVR
jgi:DNA-binding SARP family transcriptional activator